MTDYHPYQQHLLAEAQRYAAESGTRLSDAIVQAFLATPRHYFVQRYRQWPNKEWQEVTAENLAQHLPALYSNDALMLWGDDHDTTLSSISQPSLVLGMLQMLKLAPGQRVFELGAGSGWNAALMGRLVGPTGQVYSLEIIPEMAQRASAAVTALGLANVTIIAADGGDGYAAGAPYDRAIFTAGSYDLPHHFYTQLKDGALLLFILKAEGGGDTLLLLQKNGDHFESRHTFPVGFVPMTGKYALDNLNAIPLNTLPGWETLRRHEVARTPFWWGGRGRDLLWRTQGVRSFLAITEPNFRIFTTEANAASTDESTTQSSEFFGLWDEATHSLVLAHDEQLVAYGDLRMQEQLVRALHRWVEIGMPAAANFSLQLYPIAMPRIAAEHEWIVKRRESQFVWRL
jgi:protein-L-isoaspartate(D-aspartate) O-methyltransferase